MKKKIICIVSTIVVVVCFIVVACKDDKKIISVGWVKLDKYEITLTLINDVEYLTVMFIPENATNQEVFWSSNNDNIASVDKNGLVTANGEGECVITVTSIDGGKTATCKVTVLKQPPVSVENITLDKTNLTLDKINDTWQLSFEITPHNANQNVNWSSSDKNVATVSADGLVTAKGSGDCVITVTTVNGAKTATCNVTVPWHVSSITLDRSILTIAVNMTYELKATISPEMAVNKELIWSSDKPLIASVDNRGTVRGIAEGTALITVETEDGGYTATCEVTVKELDNSHFVKTLGQLFVKDGKEIIFIGGGQWIGAGWNDATYAKLSSIGFNSVRLYLDARNATISNPTNLLGTTLVGIDDNIALAKKYGMTIILNVHITPGASGISDRGFFTNSDRQQRLAAFWNAIADIYKDEPTIAGYDLINEPTVTLNPSATQNYNCNGIPYLNYFENYQIIIQRIVDAIRSVDMNHTIIMERLWIDPGSTCQNCWWFGLNDQRDCWQNYDGKYNFPDINDPAGNYAYTYHCYEPNTWCHQGPSNGEPGRNAVYPSNTIARHNEYDPSTGESWTMCKDYLEYAYTIPLKYIREVKNVPAYIGELGFLPYNYENTPWGVNRGGKQYMEDLYDILLNKFGINSSFHPYDISEFYPNMNANHEAAFRKAFGTN